MTTSFLVAYLAIGLGLRFFSRRYNNAPFYAELASGVVVAFLWPIIILGALLNQERDIDDYPPR